MPYTREEYQQKFGVDPESMDATGDEAGNNPVLNHLRAGAVGIATIPTDLAALPGTLISGAKALYNTWGTDQPFLDEFQKEQRIEGAQKNIQDHLQHVGQTWKQRDPSVSDEQINAALQTYQKSKEFEDFSMQQLSGLQRVAANWKDNVRGLLGDERTEEQRPWTESAAEIVGSSLIGGPAGMLVKGAAKVPGVAAVAATKPGNVALRTAEVFTPLTIPYTGANVALNAGVGVTLDQGLRYAQGQSSAFSPTVEDPNGVGVLAATGAGVAGLGAFVGAVMGRTRVRNQSPTAQGLANNPRFESHVADPIGEGEASIVAPYLGQHQQLQPPAFADTLSTGRRFLQSARTQLIDEANPGYRMLDDLYDDPELTKAFEAFQSSNTGSVLRDEVNNKTEIMLRDLRNAFNSMTPENQRAADTGGAAAAHMSYYKAVEDAHVRRLSEIQTELSNINISQQKRNDLIAEHGKKTTDLARLRDDNDVTARLRLPNIPTSKIAQQARRFEADASPEMVAYKQHLIRWGNEQLQEQVSAGKLSTAEAARLRNQMPIYVPAMHDPLEGTTGIQRIFKSITKSTDKSMGAETRGTGGAVLRESPIEELSMDVPPASADKESRITSLLNTRSALKIYTRQNLIDVAHTRNRNEFINKLAFDAQGQPSRYQTAGFIKPIYNAHGNEWFSAAQQKLPEIKELFSKSNVVATWENGSFRLWEFGDTDFAKMLRAEPVLTNNLIKYMADFSSWFKYFTTGLGNPFFAPKAAGYDTVVGMITRSADRSFGALSYMAHQYTPEWFSKQVVGRIPDPSAVLFLPVHAVRAIGDVIASYSAGYVARQLVNQNSAFAALQNVVGPQMFTKMVNTAIKVAHAADNTQTMQMLKKGMAKGTGQADDIITISDHYTKMAEFVPPLARSAYQFYSDLIGAIYIAPKRMFYTENFAIQHKKYNGNIPEREMRKLIYETRALGGDMSKIPASHTMRQVEAMFPYLSQTKLGTYHMARNMFGAQTASFVLPRAAMLMYAAGQSMWWRTYWNQESRDDHWKRTAEHDRWRFISVPSVDLLMAWSRGENPGYDRKLYYNVQMPPDFIWMISGTGAMMQMMGMIPASATPTPIINDLPLTIMDSLTPAMPPALQALLGASGMRLDPQGAETRGGSWVRSFNSNFRGGPQAESLTNLGQVSNSTALVMNALFGAMGSTMVQATDLALHASKFYPGVGVNGQPMPRPTSDFGSGLREALTETINRPIKSVPDIPLIWQNKEKYSVSTSAWKFVQENNTAIRSIKGMRDDATGKTSQQKRQLAVAAGGTPNAVLGDQALLSIADEITKWNNPSGELGKLHKQYSDYTAMSRGVTAARNLSWTQKQERINKIVKAQQDNLQQQHLSIKNMEAMIAEKYGPALVPRLEGRGINMRSLNQMMRESIGGATVGEGGE